VNHAARRLPSDGDEIYDEGVDTYKLALLTQLESNREEKEVRVCVCVGAWDRCRVLQDCRFASMVGAVGPPFCPHLHPELQPMRQCLFGAYT